MVTCAPIACKHKVSGSISLPSRGPFHLSLTVLYAIGHWVVFRLGGWAPRLHTGLHVSGTTLVPPASIGISRTGISPSVSCFSKTVPLSFLNPKWWSATPKDKSFGLASFPFARRYLGNRCFFLFLELLRCFSSPRFLLHAMDSHADAHLLQCAGSPIRTSAGHRIFAPHRSLSQLVTSFIGFRCQGIRLMLFLT